MSTEGMKYEIRGGPGAYSVHYGPGYPFGEFIRYTCLTLRGAKRAIRRHKRRLRRGNVSQPSQYGIIYTEDAISHNDVEARIKQLERELGMGQ